MKQHELLRLKTFVQDFLLKTRLDLKYSIQAASELLGINESLLVEYESGKKSPACYELLKILKKYQADLDTFALEVALMRIHSRSQKK